MLKILRFNLIAVIIFSIILTQACTKSCKKSEESKIRKAARLLEKNKLKECSKLLYEIIKDNPGNEKAYELRIKLNSALRKDNQVFRDYDEIVKIRGSENLPLLKEICSN